MIVTCDRPWIVADLGSPHRVLSWAIVGGGFTDATRILWREVSNTDLPPDRDPGLWLAQEIARIGGGGVCFLTSRDVRKHHHAQATIDGITVEALVTAGLSNAESVGFRRDWQAEGSRAGVWGTINIAVQIDTPLTDTALIEAVSIVTQARTTEVISAGFTLPTGTATGTGTDCIAVAARLSDAPPLPHAGLHTAVGEAIGSAVRQACHAAITRWRADWAALGRVGPGNRI